MKANRYLKLFSKITSLLTLRRRSCSCSLLYIAFSYNVSTGHWLIICWMVWTCQLHNCMTCLRRVPIMSKAYSTNSSRWVEHEKVVPPTGRFTGCTPVSYRTVKAQFLLTGKSNVVGAFWNYFVQDNSTICVESNCLTVDFSYCYILY